MGACGSTPLGAGPKGKQQAADSASGWHSFLTLFASFQCCTNCGCKKGQPPRVPWPVTRSDQAGGQEAPAQTNGANMKASQATEGAARAVRGAPGRVHWAASMSPWCACAARHPPHSVPSPGAMLCSVAYNPGYLNAAACAVRGRRPQSTSTGGPLRNCWPLWLLCIC